ncbi:MAG: saccharopine dehydrogenase NADP-binding domain-containing protein, partial [Bacteroidota bacterium]|nr:saccharopine dehydrogenase NADP-binding domain-containing protein [Bacteroidota bacterium]
MKEILILGAGKSATLLIEYLGKACQEFGWKLCVCDSDLAMAQAKVRGIKSAYAVSVDVNHGPERVKLIKKADLVISMLPPHLHYWVAQDCLQYSRHLLTASYVDQNLRHLALEIKQKDLLFLCETGLDPGIDHMSAMKLINEIRSKGGKIISFKSHCGGLVAPESDNNPWHYKITWNPGNIVMAGHSGAIFKSANQLISRPYREVFQHCQEVEVPGLGNLAWYPNRDSISYQHTYGLEDTSEFIRTTLRHPAFCTGWNAVVNLGLTDTEDEALIKKCQTYSEWFELKTTSAPEIREHYLGDTLVRELLAYLELDSPDPITVEKKCSAALLQAIIEKKLAMSPRDHDMIVMLHEIAYESNGKNYLTTSTLIVKGEDQQRTAMAKTVGLPLGIAAKLILTGKIPTRGLHIPVLPEIYEPVLA